MTVVSVKQALSGKLEAGSKVTVRGWVRTQRESKAGLSFVNVTDGSGTTSVNVNIGDVYDAQSHVTAPGVTTLGGVVGKPAIFHLVS